MFSLFSCNITLKIPSIKQNSYFNNEVNERKVHLIKNVTNKKSFVFCTQLINNIISLPVFNFNKGKIK
ncbi:MAG TPA: hypothetical protein DIC64_01075 [Alphaproteobacteria bacterium]|nr:hypothetical protein [Alphaproteobacteria bacterium]